MRVISVIEGNTKGKIWVDSIESPSTALVWSYMDMFSLGGYEGNEGFNNALENFVTEYIIREVQAIGLNFFAVQPYPLEKWGKKVENLFQMHSLKTNYEYQFTFDQKYYESKFDIPPGFSLVFIDEPFLEKECSTFLRREIEETWISIGRFMEKGIGFCLLFKDEIVCRCISRHVGGKEHNIGIVTYKEEYRNRGLATATAQAFIDHCLLHGSIPVWKADEHNSASLRVAEKLKFKKIKEYPDFYFMF